MFNLTIFKQCIKKNYKLWLVITGIVSFFACMVGFIANVNPDFRLPSAPGGGADLIDIYAGAFYGMMGLMLLLVYAITTGNKLVVSEVDKGDMSYTLNTPVNRKEVIFTKALFYSVSIFAMILTLSVVGTVFNAILSPDKLEYGLFWSINFVMLCFMFAISGISFASSCWFNKTGNALMIGAGIPIVFFLFNTIAGFGSDLEMFKYVTLNTLFSPFDIIAGNGFILEAIILLSIGIVLYSVGVVKFIKKDLPF